MLLTGLPRCVYSIRTQRERHFKTFYLVCLTSVCLIVYLSVHLVNTVKYLQDLGSENNIILYRDIFTQERWPEVERTPSLPGQLPANAHFFWCGRKLFRFEDYLGLLSVLRILKPQKLIFHYSSLPTVDEKWYHTWFQELKQSVPNLVLRYHRPRHQCGSVEALRQYLTYLQDWGGVYIG